MSRRVTTSALLALATAAALLGGCSGGGQKVGQVRGETTAAIASDHLSAAILLRRAIGVLLAPAVDLSARQTRRRRANAWAAAVRPEASEVPVMYESDTTTPDGIHIHLTMHWDSSYEQTITLPSGQSLSREAGASVWDMFDSTTQIRDTISDGTVLEYTELEQEADMGALKRTYTGTGTLPGGVTVTYELVEADGQFRLTFSASDGIIFQCTVPFVVDMDDDWYIYRPDCVQGVAGSFEGKGGKCDVKLSGYERGWQRLVFTGDGSTSGDSLLSSFAVGADMARGTGTLVQDDLLLGSLAWDANNNGVLTLMDARSEAVTPTASALRFALDLWLRSVALGAPNPGS
jgi:hypothetical protein